MPTAKKLYTFNETIVATGAVETTQDATEEELMAIFSDESNYVTAIEDGATIYMLPICADGLLMVIGSLNIPVQMEGNGYEVLHYAADGYDYGVSMAGFVCEITDMGGMSEWVLANTTSRTQIDVESPNGVKLLLTGKLGAEDIAVVPKLTEQTVTPTTETQIISAPEGFAGFKSFIVDRIPSDYVPDGYVPEGTVPDGYVPEGTVPDGYVPEGTVPDGYIKPEGELVLTENVTGMDISGKATLTTNISTGGAALNLAFGDTAPEDTGKLWVKTAEPLSVAVKLNADVTGNDGLLSGIAAIPTAASDIGAAAVGTKIYLFGGSSSNSLSTINVFDTETGTIETLSTKLPLSASNMGAAAVGTKIYLFGGLAGGSNRHSTINVFNTETGTIETLSTRLSDTVSNMGAAAVGTKIYLFGGSSSNSLSTINVFDTETGTIETLSTKLPAAANSIGTAAVGTKIYLFGGTYYESQSYYFSTINVFNTETGTIETLSTTLPTAAYGIGAAAVGTKIYLFGGRAGSRYSSIHQFTALIDLPENHLMIEASAFENRFNLLPNLEIGVKNVYLGDLFGKGKRVTAALYQDGAWVEI